MYIYIYVNVNIDLLLQKLHFYSYTSQLKTGHQLGLASDIHTIAHTLLDSLRVNALRHGYNGLSLI